MPICGRCNKDVGIFGALTFNRQTDRCSACEKICRFSLDEFRRRFLFATQNNPLENLDLTSLSTYALTSAIPVSEALSYIRGDALNLLQRMITMAAYDGVITQEEDGQIRDVVLQLGIPPQMAAEEMRRLDYLKYICSIRQGHLPNLQKVTYSAQLESDEICHMECDAIFQKVNVKSVTPVNGKLLATNKKLRFLSPQNGGTEIDWKKIMKVARLSGGVYLELSVKRGNGEYRVSDPILTEAILDTCARIAKRQVLAASADGDATRYIPQDVRITVWQRDGGKCVQCRVSSYLEYDHVIPHSKGGANTTNNVQLLCRACNLRKSNRI